MYIQIPEDKLNAVVRGAYKHSRPQGMGFLHYQDGEMSAAAAEEFIRRPDGLAISKSHERSILVVSLDYVQGRACKFNVWLSKGQFYCESRWYDHSKEQLKTMLEEAGVEFKEVELAV